MQELEIIREKIQNKYRVVKTDEDLEWNRAIDLCTNIINAHMKRVNDGWIPVEERQPEYGETVLVRWKKGGILDHSVAQYFGMSWIRDREDFIFKSRTARKGAQNESGNKIHSANMYALQKEENTRKTSV